MRGEGADEGDELGWLLDRDRGSQGNAGDGHGEEAEILAADLDHAALLAAFDRAVVRPPQELGDLLLPRSNPHRRHVLAQPRADRVSHEPGRVTARAPWSFGASRCCRSGHPWQIEPELAAHVEAYMSSGFTGGVNWYRNLDRNWHLLGEVDPIIHQPALMI